MFLGHSEVFGKSIEITNSAERNISIAWDFSIQDAESLVTAQASEFETILLKCETKSYTIANLLPGTFYKISVFPLSRGTLLSGSPVESLRPIGDPLVIEAMTLPGHFDIILAGTDEQSIAGHLEFEGQIPIAEFFIKSSYQEPIIDLFDGKLEWKFENLPSGCQFSIVGIIHDKNGTSRSTIINATTLPKAPYPVDQIFNDATSMITIVLEKTMLMTASEIFVKDPNNENTSEFQKITHRFSFHAHVSMLGYEIRTRSFSGDTVGKWFTFYIGISLVKDLKFVYHYFNLVTFIWSLTPGKISHLIFSYNFPHESLIGNYTSDQIYCQAALLACNISLLLFPGIFPTFSITPFLEGPNIFGKTSFYSFVVPLTVNSSYSSSDYADRVSTVTVTANFYGYFEKAVSRVKQLGIVSFGTENGESKC